MKSRWAVTAGKGHIFLWPKPPADFSWPFSGSDCPRGLLMPRGGCPGGKGSVWSGTEAAGGNVRPTVSPRTALSNAELWSISNISSPSNYFTNSTPEGRRHGHIGREESTQAQDSEPLPLAHTVRCPLHWDLWPVPVSCTGCSAPQLPDD